jgi:hypothetical protein
MLNLVEEMICDLQLTVLVWRRKCTTVEKVILMLQLPKLAWDGGVAFIACSHTHALLDNGPGKVVLQVEWVLSVLDHHIHTGMEVRALEVGHGLKALLPYGGPWLRIGMSVIGITTVAVRRLSHKEVSLACVV